MDNEYELVIGALGDDGEREANARLIAAAPALLAQIERFCAAYELNRAGTLGNGQAFKSLPEFRKLLAQVRGESAVMKGQES